MGFMEKVFGTHSQRELKKIEPLVEKVMGLEDSYSKLTDEQLRAAGIEAGMIRLSVGLEDVDDIIEDLEQAFKKVN